MTGKLTIQELAKVLVDKNSLTPQAANKFAAEMFSLILERLQQGEQVKVKGLGTFKIIDVEARESVSVRTGERFVIDGHSKVTFTPDAVMKELVNRPFSQFETVVLNDGVEFADISVQSGEADDLDVPAEAMAGEEPPQVQTATEPADNGNPVEDAVAEQKEEIIVPVEESEAEPEKVNNEPAEEPVLEAEDHEPDRSWLRLLLGGLGVLLLMALSAIFGYQYGHTQQVSPADSVIVHDTIYMAAPQDPDETEEDTFTVVETVPQKDELPPVDPYAAKDERVRLGAYRIVGTAEEITVQSGQTFYSICRAHLGPDMECYVEVYNNLPKQPTIQVGQTIKIPKLELKRRSNKNSVR